MTNVLRTASHRSGPGGGACAAIGGRGVRSVELERGGGSILYFRCAASIWRVLYLL